MISPPPRNGRSIWLLILPGGILAFLLIVPLVALLVQSIEAGLSPSLLGPVAFQAIKLSLMTSTVSLLIVILTGTPLAYILARWTFRGRGWVELFTDLPIVLPPSVAGLALLMAFGRNGLLGEALSFFGLSFPFTTAAVVLAQTFVAGPLYVRAARIGFAAVDKQMEEAAYTEGATHFQMFRYVMIPSAFQALIGGAILCWARALGEFGATILFAGNLIGRTQTMPLAVYIGLETDINVALALSVLLMFVSALLLALLRRIEKAWTIV